MPITQNVVRIAGVGQAVLVLDQKVLIVFFIKRDCGEIKTFNFDLFSIKVCRINIDRLQYTPNQPLYAEVPFRANSVHRIYPIDRNGEIFFGGDRTVEIDCPNGFASNPNLKAMVVKCDHDDIVLTKSPNHRVRFEDLRCAGEALAMTMVKKEKCAMGEGIQIEFGFKVGTIWIPSTLACFNPNEKRTYWVRHQLLESSTHFQHEVERTEYTGDEFFDKLKMNAIYSPFGQFDGFKARLGEAMASQMISVDRNGIRLQRGHLSAVAEYPFGQQQRSMSNWVLVMPQWSIINNEGGNWHTFEINIRGAVSESQINAEVYSGTHGTLKKNGIEIYASKCSKQVPVPQYYYKVLMDHQKKTAFVGIVVNDPFANATEIQNIYNTLCPDVYNQVDAKFWDRERLNPKYGYAFACTLKDFLQSVPELAELKRYSNYGLMKFNSYFPKFQPRRSQSAPAPQSRRYDNSFRGSVPSNRRRTIG